MSISYLSKIISGLVTYSSEYGQCGTGAYCLGGCDPRSSFALDSCTPEPVCEDKKYTWDNLDNAAPNNEYLGNASKYDWMYSGDPKIEDGNLLLTMANNTDSSLFASNHYIWYGKVTGKLKSSRGKGVVTAFILMSDVKDEIDYEFVGSDLSKVQTNYYFQGILDCKFSVHLLLWGRTNWIDNHGGKADVDGSTFDDWHTYEIDWNPDTITWSVDGDAKRTLKKSDTWNATTNQFMYPQTPSRLQMSLWPAGRPSNPKGTIEWAGGEIDWDSEDMKKKGYYYATIGEVSIECYKPPKGANVNGDKSYIYTDEAATNNTIEITDKDTVLSSFGATGANMTVTSSSPTATATGNDSDTVPEVHGGSGNEPGRTDGGGGSSGDSGSGSGSGGGGDTSTFVQGNDDSSSGGSGSGSGDGKNAASSPNERVLRGSLLAVTVALVVLMTL